MSKNVPKQFAKHRAKQYHDFLQKNGIKIQSSPPIFNANGKKLVAGERVKPKAKLSKKERKALKKLRKKKLKANRQKLFHGRRNHLETSKADLKAMPYGEFLESGYWRYVRMLVLKRDRFRCQKCSAPNRLQVHHLTYAHHGEEHKFLNELLTLCDTCHQDAHGLGDHKPKLERHKSPAVNRIATAHFSLDPATCKPSPINGTGSGVSKPALQAEHPCSSDPHRSPVASGMGRVTNQGSES